MPQPQPKKYTIRVGLIPIEVTHKDVKHLRIVAYPSRKSVRISSPNHVSRHEVREFAESKAAWIRKHFENPRIENRDVADSFDDGSTHFLWGKPLRLRVNANADRYLVRQLDHQTVMLHVKPGTTQDVRERVMREWYRRELKRPIPGLIKKWEPVMGVAVNEWNVKKMKTRWGTCNTKAGRIWISLHLAKKEPEFLEYILVHEMTHLLERGHTRRFYRLMDSFHPTWRDIDRRLGGRHWKKSG
jgi:hypothetical protein